MHKMCNITLCHTTSCSVVVGLLRINTWYTYTLVDLVGQAKSDANADKDVLPRSKDSILASPVSDLCADDILHQILPFHLEQSILQPQPPVSVRKASSALCEVPESINSRVHNGQSGYVFPNVAV